MNRIFIAFVLALVLLMATSCIPSDVQNPLTEEEKEWIARNRDMRVGVSFHYPPYEEYGIKDKYEGLSADYIRLVNEKTGLGFVPVRFRNRGEVLHAVELGDVDVIAALEMTDDRRKFLDFTQPYVNVPAAIITRKEFKDELTLEKLGGMRIGVTVSPEFDSYLLKHYPGDYTIVPMSGGYIGGLRSLAVGDVDALICDMALASRYIANARISNLRIAGITNYSIDLRIASLKDKPVLGQILRKGLAMILPHERQVIEEKWLTLHYRPIWTNWKFWMGLLSVLGIVLGIVVLVLVWNRSLKKQVNQRTAALFSINKVLLGSLECRTELDVMTQCLVEAKSISYSEQAFWGEIERKELVPFLHTEGEGNSALRSELRGKGIALGQEQIEMLSNGQVALLSIAEAGRDPNHLIIVPLQVIDGIPMRVIAVMRKNRMYISAEIALLVEVLFAFEEALQRKRAEISLHEKELQLQSVQRMEALGNLAGGIAHDFNNILGVIISSCELIEIFHTDASTEIQSKVNASLAAAYRGRDLVSQILTFTRKGHEEVRSLRVGPIVAETVRFLQASLSASVKINYSIVDPEPIVFADPTQVHQVLMNLCTNAAHAMEVSGGLLSISVTSKNIQSEHEIEGLSRKGLHLVLEVRDSGEGIQPDELARIFDPFFTTKCPGKGTGLGLAVVQGIVKSWGGAVVVESIPAKGTVFRILMPAEREGENVSAPLLDGMELGKGTGSILLVDDEQDLVLSCSEFLTGLGYTVCSETDSQKAYRLFMQKPENFDLIITDYNMPGLNGARLSEKVLDEKSDIPIIMCSGYSDSFDSSAAISIGIREYLKKPVSLKELALAVRRYIEPGFK
ncbi:response regulator [Marinifilum sp. JC120]|nr:response regulator [Marinifilum sp. JC120]